MEKIKSFFYLDNDKLKSLSSQMFEGITKDFVDSARAQKQETEEQKGEYFSGNKLGDTSLVELYKSESKFVHDHLFNKFEKELINEEKLKFVNSDSNDNLGVHSEKQKSV